MNSAVLLIPLFLIRYGLLALLDKNALPRAVHFAPMEKTEKLWYWVYQLATAAMLVYMFFLRVKKEDAVFWAGLAVYAVGVLLLVFSTAHFAKPGSGGICQSGLYRFSRNPMYVAYFVYFCGCALLGHSVLLFALLCVFQLAAHRVILAEERWCIGQFGEEYIQYMKKVRRYL